MCRVSLPNPSGQASRPICGPPQTWSLLVTVPRPEYRAFLDRHRAHPFEGRQAVRRLPEELTRRQIRERVPW